MTEQRTSMKNLLSYFGIIAKELAALTSINETMDNVLKHIEYIFNPEVSSVLLKKKDGTLKFISVSGTQAGSLKNFCLKPGEGVAGWIVQNGQNALLPDVYQDERFNPEVDKMTGFQTRSIIGVPLKTSNRIFGVLELINRLDRKPFTDVDLLVLNTIADLSAIAIERLYFYYSMMKYYATDPVSGLYNQKAFLSHISLEKQKCQEPDAKLSLLVLKLARTREMTGTSKIMMRKSHIKSLAGLLKRCALPESNIYRINDVTFSILSPESRTGNLDRCQGKILTEFKSNPDFADMDLRLDSKYYVLCSESTRDVIQQMDLEKALDKEREEGITSADEMGEAIEMFMSKERQGHTVPGATN